MTDLAERDSFTHLNPAAARLGSLLARPRAIAAACVVGLAGLGWLYLGIATGASSDTGFWAVLCRPSLNTDASVADAVLIAPMWAAMVLAMMLPSAGPMVLTYAEIADTAARKGEHVVSPFILTAGYVVVWLGFAAIAAVVQITLARTALLDDSMAITNGALAGALFIAAGLYQFSSLKQACLTQCQRPFPFFFANWTTKTRGVFELGLRQGLHCLGCCWAMMLLMFAVGAMNVVWLAALGIVMTIEKMTTTRHFSHVLGAIFVLSGVTLVIRAIV